MAEEIKSITSSIVTHTEKLWVTATQAPPRATQESTFTADGKSGLQISPYRKNSYFWLVHK